MLSITLTFRPVGDGLPDPETNVLLALSNGACCEGFLDADPDRDIWRDVTADEIDGVTVLGWAEMPTRLHELFGEPIIQAPSSGHSLASIASEMPEAERQHLLAMTAGATAHIGDDGNSLEDARV